jgi:hypothetical protein
VRRRIEPSFARNASLRGHLGSEQVRHERVRYESARRPARRTSALRSAIEERLVQISVVSLLVGAAGWGLLLFTECRSLFTSAPGAVALHSPNAGNADFGRADAFAVSTYAPAQPKTAAVARAVTGGESAATVVAREWNAFQPPQQANLGPAPAKTADIKPPVRVASLPSATPQAAVPRPAPSALAPQAAVPRPAPSAVAPQLVALHPATDMAVPRVPASIEAKTSLVDFETSPFPYHGNMPGSDKPFLNAGEEGHRGHVNFRGHVLWEAQTYSDDHVLLHIPPGFDPKRPAVMVVFFHGHGADLARDVRDRQRLPDQITAAGANAVLVAPQFAFDAADSSAGKFWEPDGFKKFLDEAAQKLAKMYGDPRSAVAFGRMPIVIVAYSGGFGPTLAVLDRGGVGARLRGLVLLDALYAGIDNFADWIANNRSAFFVSSYTPYTEYHNADLEHLLTERAVPYGSELKRDHLQGTVTFLPAGDVPHRDFVTHAWTDNPITDILARMDDVDPKIETATVAAKSN